MIKITFIRDLLPLIGIIGLLFVFLRTIVSFQKLKKSLRNKNTSSNKCETTLSRLDLEYARILVILAVTTAISFSMVSTIRFFAYDINAELVAVLLQVNGFMASLRNSCVFFE